MTRRGLVLGGGGVLGAAWMIGALSALEVRLGVDARSFDQLVGTSAGSVLCTLLAAGVSVSDLRRHQLDGHVASGPLAGFEWDYDEATGGDPPRPRRRGSAHRCCCARVFVSCGSCHPPPCWLPSCPRAGAGSTASGR